MLEGAELGGVGQGAQKLAPVAAASWAQREEYASLFTEDVRDHPGVTGRRLDRMISPSDMKHLLIRMEHEATTAAIEAQRR